MLLWGLSGLTGGEVPGQEPPALTPEQEQWRKEADKLIKGNAVALFAAPTGSEIPVTGPSQKLEAGEYIVRVGKRYKHVTV